MKLFGREFQTPSARVRALEQAAAAHQAEAESAREAVRELARVIASSPIPGMPVPGMAPPTGLPLYQYDHAIRWSTPQSPQRRPDSLVSMETLRQLADSYDILRSCINHVRRELAAVPLSIVARDAKAQKSGAAAKRIAEAEEFFKPGGGLGGVGRRRSQFEAMWAEDLLVIGATCWYFEPTRGGGLYEVLPIDAATIRPRVDAYGWPGPGELVLEQWNQGVQVAAFTREQMVYDGVWPVTHSPYFKSSVEWVLRPSSTGIAADDWNGAWLKDGTAPSDWMIAPESWTPEMVMSYYAWITDLLTGNTRERVKMKIAPGGARLGTHSRRDQEFSELERWMMHRCCSVFGVHPAAIGFEGSQYAVTQQNSMDQTSAFGVGQLLEFRKARYDDLLDRLGFEELETQNVVGQEEAAKERAERISVLVNCGVMKQNEGRSIEGLDPDPEGNTLLVPTSLTTIKALLAAPEGAPEGGKTEPGGAAAQEERPSGARSDRLAAALGLWERKALRRLKDGRPAACRFESEELPAEIVRTVSCELASCVSAEDVRRVFMAVPGELPAAAGGPSDRQALMARWRQRRMEHEAMHGPAATGDEE